MPSQEQARERLEALIKSYNALTASEREQQSETDVIVHFVQPLLRDVLGWPFDPQHLHSEVRIASAGRVDMRFDADNGEVIYVEAKRFGVIEKLARLESERVSGELRREADRRNRQLSDVVLPSQMGLPGMIVDRTREEQQAINYAFQNDGTWAMLVNFERLRLFNARRDWLVLSFEDPAAFLANFHELWQLSYEEIMKGTLDALSKQRYREDVDSKYLEFISLWREKLANDIVANPQDNRWAFHADASLNLLLVRGVVQRVIDRLVVVRFAEDHLVVPAGTLYGFYEHHRANPYTFSMYEFLNRFFKSFDEKHNSALFARDVADEAKFSDIVLEELTRDLYKAKYRAMPADILGNTYEQYLGKALVLENGAITSRDNLETRKKQGSYYTPQVIVQYLVENSLGRYLYGTEDGKPNGNLIEGERRKTSSEIKNLRVLDSACGSGSFLIRAYYVLDEFYKAEFKRQEDEVLATIERMSKTGKSRIDIELEISELRAEIERIRDYPNLILETHLYGTDLDPQAAELAVVNLMMRALEKQGADKTLPLILNQNVKVGNALIGLRHDEPRLLEHAPALARLRALRIELIGTKNTDPRHDVVVEELEKERAALYALFHADFASKFSDLERVRPFHWGIEFPEAFYDAEGKLLENAGFEVIIGNPPWDVVMPDERKFYAQYDARVEKQLQADAAIARIEELNQEDPDRRVRWLAQKTNIEENASYFGASTDYQFQHTGHKSTEKLFVERMYLMLRNSGRLGYLIPSGIYSYPGTRELRKLFFDTGKIEYLFGIANVKRWFDLVDTRFKFSLIGVHKGVQADRFPVKFFISHADWKTVEAINKEEALQKILYDDSKLFTMSRDIINHFDSKDLTVMEFQIPLDYQIAEKMYHLAKPLGNDITGWEVVISQDFNMTTDNHLFNEDKLGYPLYEGKHIHQFDSLFAQPRYYIESGIGLAALKDSRINTWNNDYRFAYRDVSNATNERTILATILPKNSFVGHTLWVGHSPDNSKSLIFVAILNSFCNDWLGRLKISTHVTKTIMKTLPFPRLNAGNPYFDALVPRAAQLTCTREEFADLWQEVMGGTWDASCGATDIRQRQKLRDEIDAIVAHLYGLSRDEFAHILNSFALVFPSNEAGQAKKAELLRVYDEWAEKTKDWSRA